MKKKKKKKGGPEGYGKSGSACSGGKPAQKIFFLDFPDCFAQLMEFFVFT